MSDSNLKGRREADYYKLYYQQKDRIKVLQKELTTYRKYAHIVRAIKYILAYSERVNLNILIDMIKNEIKHK